MSRDFRHIRSSRYRASLLHDLVHHEVRIFAINFVAVFTSFQRGRRMRRHFDQPLQHASTVLTSQVQKLNQSASLFPLEAWRKSTRRGIFSGQFLTNIRSGHVSLIRNSRRQTIAYAKQCFSLGTSPTRSLEHSSFRRVNRPEDTHPPEESAALRALLLPRTSPPRDQFFSPELGDCCNQLHWYPPTFTKSVTPPNYPTFQML